MILDSTVLIDLLRGDEDAIRALEALKEPARLTAISVFELHNGIVQSNKPEEEKERVKELLDGQIIFPLTARTAARAGEIDGELIMRGEPISTHDCMIASTALERGEAVLTRNEKHFSRIDGLHVQTY